MHTSIDFLTENLLSALDRQCRHLLAQDFTGFDRLLISLCLGSSDDLVALAFASSTMA